MDSAPGYGMTSSFIFKTVLLTPDSRRHETIAQINKPISRWTEGALRSLCLEIRPTEDAKGGRTRWGFFHALSMVAMATGRDHWETAPWAPWPELPEQKGLPSTSLELGDLRRGITGTWEQTHASSELPQRLCAWFTHL